MSDNESDELIGSTTDPRLLYLLDEAVKSMDARAGIRAGMYIRAAHDFAHGRQSNALDICLEMFEPNDEVSG